MFRKCFNLYTILAKEKKKANFSTQFLDKTTTTKATEYTTSEVEYTTAPSTSAMYMTTTEIYYTQTGMKNTNIQYNISFTLNVSLRTRHIIPYRAAAILRRPQIGNTLPQMRGGVVTKPTTTLFNFDKVWNTAPDGHLGKLCLIRNANNFEKSPKSAYLSNIFASSICLPVSKSNKNWANTTPLTCDMLFNTFYLFYLETYIDYLFIHYIFRVKIRRGWLVGWLDLRRSSDISAISRLGSRIYPISEIAAARAKIEPRTS